MNIMNRINGAFILKGAAALVAALLVTSPAWPAQKMMRQPSDGMVERKAVLKLDKNNMGQLKSLSDSDVVEIKGKQLTKKKMLENLEANQKRYIDARKADAAKTKATFAAKRAALLRDQKAKLDAGNASTKSEIQKAQSNSQQIAKIKVEALQMNAKYASASPEEKNKMDQRAGELKVQLKNLGY